MFKGLESKVLSYISTRSDGNIAYHVPDSKTNVDANRQRLAIKLGYNHEALRYMEQVHLDTIIAVDDHSPLQLPSCDALITNSINLPIMVMVADCIPILYYDPITHSIGVAHAGRNGSFLSIASKTVQSMVDAFGSRPSDILVHIGPSIGKCCYEIDEAMASIVKTSFGERYINGRLLDLPILNQDQLVGAGIQKEHISRDAICTQCGGDAYYSYRSDKNTGRFAGIMMLR